MTSYGALCTEFYDLDKPLAPTEALAYYLGRAREVGGRILEPMCGSGRFLIPMLQAGVRVDGVDCAPAMLEACRRRANALGLEVELYAQGLEALALPHRYALAFVPAGSIGLIAEGPGFSAALTNLSAHLEPGAPLLLEVVNSVSENPDSRSGAATEDEPIHCEPRTVKCPDGATIAYSCVVSRSRAPEAISYAGTYEKREGGRLIARETEELVLSIRPAESLVAELLRCGFDSARVIRGPEAAFLEGSGCTLIEARAG